ncbi:hypothetical protein JRG49_03695 [Pseudomonas fulva]|jgi:DNA-binding CsgD family transcriptional regulator|uniref:hypothetical protein n=1 Tax=Pseudomonas TaxID=286 RepID=UPI0006D47C54|nr:MULTISPECIES: hypothetical protein [Pseudomonas]MCY4126699.1 hypothetical protein [Pseudomonas sp.]AYN13816.1 hypothetical protein CHR29_01080 [Pseudomonas monteilii]MBG6883055.1 hypothetical protein [Pseudomonas aeruginosa]MBH3536655.1 hypothetical protein [Pseudomonas aeruginosa]MBN6789344.1 hypothetical protein [Pseudomonas fulva]
MGDWKACIGKMSDREVARRFGLGASTVRRYRHSIGIPEFHPEDIELPTELIEQLATRTNYQLAQEFGVSIKRIKRKRGELRIQEPKTARERFKPLEDIWTNEAIAMLGKMPDTEVADRLDISNFPVKKKRHELGIQAYKRPLPKITPEIASAFGVVSDAELARQLGVSVNYIRKARIKASQQ